MKTRLLWIGVASILAVTATAQADEKDMRMAKQPAMVKKNGNTAGLKKTDDARGRLPDNAGPSGRGPGGDAPKKNSRFMGHQGGPSFIQTPSGSASSQSNSRKRGVPSGPDWMNQGKDKNRGEEKKSLDSFSREARLAELTNPSKGIDNMPQGKSFEPRRGVLPGQKVFDTNVSRGTVEQGYGKNQSDRRSQQSEGVEEYNTTFDEDVSAASGSRVLNTSLADQERKTKEADYAQRVGGIDSDHYKNTQDMSDKQRRDYWKEVERKQKLGGPNSMPNPDSPDGDESHLPSALRGLEKKKSLEETQRERKRQVTLPNENQRPLGPADVEVTQKDRMRRMTDGRITPVDGDGTTSGSAPTGGEINPGQRSPNNPTGKNPTGPSTGPIGPGDPADDEDED